MDGASMRAARRLVPAIALVACVLPGTAARAQAVRWPSEAPPRALPAKDVPFPPYQLQTLDNGLQLVVVMHHEQPAVSVQMIVRAGTAQDPPGKSGVAALVTTLLDQGTTRMTARDVADLIDTVGGALDTGTGRDLISAHVTVMKDSFDLGLKLLSEVVRTPAFADAEIERQRQQTLSGLKVGHEDPEYVANVVFDRLVYGFHPYGFPGNGSLETLPKISREDLVAFHQRYFHPNNSLLAVVGDITTEEAAAAVHRAFGDWPRRDAPADVVPDPPPATRRVLVIDKPDAVQTEVRVGHLGIPRTQKDYTALDLAVKILGGEGANRLHRVLRVERGLTYGASAEMETLKRAGELTAVTNTRPETTGEVLRLIVDEYWRLVRDRVDERELEEAKKYLTGSFPLSIETPDDIAMQILDVLFYELPIEELQTFRRRVNAVTVDDIARVAREYLKPDRLSVVLVGNAASFVNQLRGVGFGKYELVPIADLDLSRPDFVKPPSASRPHDAAELPSPGASASRSGPFEPEQSSAGEAARDAARQALQRAVDAKGGLERLNNIRTLVATSRATMFAASGPVHVETKTFISYPDRFRVETKGAQVGETVQVYAEGQAWVKDASGVHDVPDAELAGFRGGVERDVLNLLRRAMAGDLTVRVVSNPERTRGSATSLELSGPLSVPVVLEIDNGSGLVLRALYTADTPKGRVAIEEAFSNSRAVDGVQFARHATVKWNGTLVLERDVKEIGVNVPLGRELFVKPSPPVGVIARP
jgi:zinc protease